VRAVRKASALSKAKGLKVPRVHLDFGPDGLTVSPGLDVAEEQARVRGIPAPGEPLAGGVLDGPLKVNGTFLLDALRAFSGDTLVVHAQAPSRPFLLTDGVSVAGEGFRLLLMPVRIR
jgi:DNA polymerase-3 subunit beta